MVFALLSSLQIPTFQTSVELFASASHAPIGSLAFSIANQQLFIRVSNGWRNIPVKTEVPKARIDIDSN